MDTAEALKLAMAAIKEAGIPESLWPTALPLALDDLRGKHAASPAKPPHDKPAKASKANKTATKSAKSSPRPTAAPAGDAVLATIPDETTFFKSIEKETGVPVSDLADVFHVDAGKLEFKLASKDLGTGSKQGTQSITALLGGAVFAGTTHRKLPFVEIHEMCKARHFFNSGNASAFIKGTTGFAAVGSGPSLSLTTTSGWQDAFEKAINKALKKPAKAA